MQINILFLVIPLPDHPLSYLGYGQAGSYLRLRLEVIWFEKYGITFVNFEFQKTLLN